MPTDFRLDNGRAQSAEGLPVSRQLHVVCLKCGLIVDRRRKSTDLRSPEELHARVQCGNCFARAASGDVIFSFDGGVTFHQRAQDPVDGLPDDLAGWRRPTPSFERGDFHWQERATVDQTPGRENDPLAPPASPHLEFWRSSLRPLAIVILVASAAPLAGLFFGALKLIFLTYGVFLDPSG